MVSTPNPQTQTRRVSSRIDLAITEPADLVFSVAVAAEHPVTDETLSMTVDGQPVDFSEFAGPAGARLHRAAGTPMGDFVLEYAAVVPDRTPAAPPTELDYVQAKLPSRYCDSDRMGAVAASMFGHLEGEDLVRGVVSWVNENIAYVPGSTGPIDGALDVFLQRMGVCRDTAQLTITFLRARNLAARLVSVYAPGLSPMDFHAVTEVYVDGQWQVVDATGLAPRQSLVRIATGRDAADTAFLTVLDGRSTLKNVEVSAVVDGELPVDDGVSPVTLS